MLYMLFFASCIHSLTKSQLEKKRVGNNAPVNVKPQGGGAGRPRGF